MAGVKAVKSQAHQLLKQMKSAKGVVSKDASVYVEQDFDKPVKSQNAKKIYSTVDGGRLHVAAGENYTGSIDSYNYWITRFFANLFGWSTEININSKTYTVNKEDFARWLNNNTAYNDLTGANVAGFVDFSLFNVIPKQTLGTMRTNISAEKSDRLFVKLVNALVLKNDIEAAQKYVGKGANLDKTYWVRDGYPISFQNLTTGIDAEKATTFDATLYTPLLYAAEHSNQAFCDFLQTFKADTSISGQSVLFTRATEERNKVTSIDKTEEFKSNDGRTITRLTLLTTYNLAIEDTVAPQYEIYFDEKTNSIVDAASKSPVVIEKYSKNKELRTVRYM
jgi:hypothetical protein